MATFRYDGISYILVTHVPRIINSSGKVSTIEMPWADYSDRSFSCCIEVIQLLQLIKNQTKTADYLKTSLYVVNSIMTKAISRSLSLRLTDTTIESIVIDEKSFKKGHEYC